MTTFNPGDRIIWNYAPPRPEDPIVPTPGTVLDVNGDLITIEVEMAGRLQKQVLHKSHLTTPTDEALTRAEHAQPSWLLPHHADHARPVILIFLAIIGVLLILFAAAAWWILWILFLGWMTS